MCSRGNVQSGKYPLGEIATRTNVWSGKCRSGSCPVGDVSVGEVSVGEMSSQGSVRRAIFLVWKLYKLWFYLTTYFGHGQCFVWEFLILAFVECASLTTASFGNFSWFGNDKFWSANYICQICKSKLFRHARILNKIYFGSVLLVSFAKYVSLQIYSQFT